MSEQLTVTQPIFNEELRRLQTTDSAHPDTWNPSHQRLLENDHWLRNAIQSTQQEVQDILGSDPVQLSDQLAALVDYGAQRVFTERATQVPEHTITSAVSGDDSIDLQDTEGVEPGQHYHINDRGNVQTVRVAEVLSTQRILLTQPLTSTVATGSAFSRLAPGRYTTPQLLDMERGGTMHAQGDIDNAQGWGGGAWQNLVKRADGGYDIPAGVDRLRINGNPTRVAVISALPISVTRRAENASPADGDTGQTISPTLQGAPYYPLYGVPQERRQFQIIEAGGSFADPLYEAEEVPVDSTPLTDHAVSATLQTDRAYQWRYRDRTAEDEWAPWSLPTSFSTADTYIATPSVTSPLDDATDIPEQPVIELSAFSVVNGTDTHAATSIRIKDNTGATVWELDRSTNPLNSIVVPAGILQPGERAYTIEPRHHGVVYGDSAWGAAISVTTATSFVPDFESEIGAPYGGGYVAGTIVSDYDGQTYGLIVSDGGGDSSQQGDGTMMWRTSRTAVSNTDGVPPRTLADGQANRNAILALASLNEFPAFKWVEDNCNSGAGLNGHNDWYPPSKDELDVIFGEFAPDGASTPDSFKTGGPDAFTASSYYWTSTEYSSTVAWSQRFSDGYQNNIIKDGSYYVRAVRRIAL